MEEVTKKKKAVLIFKLYGTFLATLLYKWWIFEEALLIAGHYIKFPKTEMFTVCCVALIYFPEIVAFIIRIIGRKKSESELQSAYQYGLIALEKVELRATKLLFLWIGFVTLRYIHNHLANL
jgi:hypothetical protein